MFYSVSPSSLICLVSSSTLWLLSSRPKKRVSHSRKRHCFAFECRFETGINILELIIGFRWRVNALTLIWSCLTLTSPKGVVATLLGRSSSVTSQVALNACESLQAGWLATWFGDLLSSRSIRYSRDLSTHEYQSGSTFSLRKNAHNTEYLPHQLNVFHGEPARIGNLLYIVVKRDPDSLLRIHILTPKKKNFELKNRSQIFRIQLANEMPAGCG